MPQSRPLHRTAIMIAMGLLVVGLAACGDLAAVPQVDAAGFVRDASQLPRVDQREDAASIIAEVALDDGGLIRFIDESDGVEVGTVGILELTAPDAAPLAASFREEQVTPLELFRAVAPDRRVPDRLVAHHRAMAMRSGVVESEPRSLRLDGDADRLQKQDGGVLWSWCSSANTFRTSYHYALHKPNEFAHFGFGGNLSGTKYGVTGKASRRALSVCSHAIYGNTGVSVWREYAPNQWMYVQGTSYDMIPHRGMWYASQDPSFMVPTRYRVSASGPNYSIAGSWGQE